jgi:antitoxin HigA-1
MADPIRRDELHRIDLSDVATGETLANIAPGEVLREEFMVPLGLSARGLARDLGVPANRITAILHGERAITAETAVLLSERFGTSPEFWLNLQVAFDLEAVRRSRSIQRAGTAISHR